MTLHSFAFLCVVCGKKLRTAKSAKLGAKGRKDKLHRGRLDGTISEGGVRPLSGTQKLETRMSDPKNKKATPGGPLARLLPLHHPSVFQDT